MSTNQTMPLLIWFNCEDKINLLGVIDERSTRNDIASYNAQALASGTELTLRYKSYLFEFPYKKYVTTLNADKTVIADYMNRAVSIINKSMPLVSFFVILLTPLTLFLLNVSFLLMSSLFVLLFFKTMKRHYAYRTIFHVGLHSSTLPMLVSLLFLLFPIHITSSLILFFFLIFVFQLVGVYEAHYSEHLAHHK